MRYLFVTVMFFSTFVHAEYLRSIRISSFATKVESQQALAELQEFIVSHENIVNLQTEWDFEFKARKSGRYYITLVEPFTQRKVLQEVIDTLRINYADVYVTSIKKKKTLKAKAEIIPEVLKIKDTMPEAIPLEEVPSNTEIQEEVPEVEELTINQDVDVINLNESNQSSKVSKLEEFSAEPESYIIEEVQTKKISPNNADDLTQYTWPLISFGLFIIILFLLRAVLKYKKENEIYFNSELINNEKFNQLSLEIKDREKYLSHASHELRSPMTAIMGLTHLVLDSDLARQEKEHIKQIESSAANLLNIINDILDVSKIKAGELHIEKTEFNINDILEYVLNTISIQAKDNNIDCLADIEKDVPSHLIGDSLRLGQVLINLLGNAVKFTKDGKVSLVVKKLSSSGDNITLEFMVSDDGIGMSPEQLETVFQSFAQANESTSRKFGGTGLGLSISQELVRMMNGEIKVKSEVGKGTTFSFSISFKLKDHLNKRQYRLPSSKFLNKRILLIDRSDKNVMQLIRMLGYFKYKVHTVPSLEDSVLDEDMLFDIVIIHKNQLNNLIVERLIRMQREQKFKLVVLSELFSKLNSDTLKNLEVDTYLQIPFNQQNILNMIIDLYVSKKLDNKSRPKTSKNALYNIRDKKILVAEDNEVNHKVISGLLAETGVEIKYVLNGREAVDTLLSGERFDLVLMDISMPIMNGYEATREIRSHKIFDNIPILALTADVMDKAVKEALDSGMQGHISKPIIIDIFYKKIYDALHMLKQEKDIQTVKRINVEKQDNEYEEISISVGLERYNNDKDFYNSILKDFKKMYINSALELEELCRVGDYKGARHKAMDIKDVSLSIGAYKLCESAATMEYSLEKGPRSNWVKLIEFYEVELRRLFKDIDKYLKKNH